MLDNTSASFYLNKLDLHKFDGLVKSRISSVFVIPANAGIQEHQVLMDSRVRGSDGLGGFFREVLSFKLLISYMNITS